MRQNHYDGIASQLAQKEQEEKTIEALRSLHDQPNAQVFINVGQQRLDGINSVLTSNFAMMEASCSRLEQSLANATKVVNEKRSFEAGIRNQVKQTEKTLKETTSKNQELNLKINTSKNELSLLTQEKQTIIADKSNLVSSMNDQQKFFVLKKAQHNQDIEIIDLLISSGFNEQTYLSLHNAQDEIQIVGEQDEVPDVFD
jgi:hypothetical protein